MGEGKADEAAGDHHGFRTGQVYKPGPNPSPTTLEADIKTFPSLPPPTTERTGGYIKALVFENFQNFREPRFKMSKSGFWVFSSHRVREEIPGLIT